MEGTRVDLLNEPQHQAISADSIPDDEQLLAALYVENAPEEATFSFVIGKPDACGYYRCPNGTCDRKYKIKYSLIRHLRNECIDNRRFPCPSCKKKFSYSFILNRHLQKVHKINLHS